MLASCGGSRQEVAEDSIAVEDTVMVEIDSAAMEETDSMMTAMDSTMMDSTAMEVVTDSVE
ncbi:hypothetical protein [Chondrinema litorale]|uniref:hypothetical protein n=1 Tax=Chondrinema litorale TaxID=2994555 RepID=UPI002542C6E9|nr:hypothetical protein [Chondrinema litorale]UZR97255.1 hypothetical protein OQ292_25480 [Chondrinema litorale]